MDPTALLKKQHRGVEGLFKKILKAEEPQECRQLLEELRHALEMHMQLEEEMFYPAVREVAAKKADVVLEAYEEHGVVKLVLERLPEVDPEDERFHAKMTVLQELVKHHVDEEEKEMFKLAKKLGKDELKSLGERLAAEAGGEPGREPRGRRQAA
jgi:hemerythrin superfamily protein